MVEGDISPFGFSDRYLRQDNPFRTREKEGFKGGTKIAVISPVATVIGRKRYGGALVLGFVLLAASIVAAHAADRKCIREMFELYEDMTVAKRQCDPKNFVTNPNEYGWVRYAPECKPVREKGAGAKQQKDAPCE